MAHPPTLQYVIVWEWCDCRTRWRPYNAVVSRVLEKAYRSRLTQVLLGDADPHMVKYRVSLTSMVQIHENSEDVANVRRSLYPRTSPMGQGVRWDWLGDKPNEWFIYEVEVQTVLETNYSQGAQTLDLSKYFKYLPYIANFCNMTQVRKNTGFVRSIRRIIQSGYPLALRNECPAENTVPKDHKDKDNTQKTSKPAWFLGLVNAVKSHHKVASAGKDSVDGHKSHKNHCERGRPESRTNVRIERRARSSSLETVTTCLSQDDDGSLPHTVVAHNA